MIRFGSENNIADTSGLDDFFLSVSAAGFFYETGLEGLAKRVEDLNITLPSSYMLHTSVRKNEENDRGPPQNTTLRRGWQCSMPIFLADSPGFSAD